MKLILVPSLLVSCVTAAQAPAATAPPTQDVASPEQHLGRPVGTDFELADWAQTSAYYRRLASESPNVLVERIGATTEGRDFLLATISSPANLARLEEIRAHAAVLADPRGRSAEEKRRAVEDGVVILFVSCSMHATETAGTEFGMEFSHRLATSDEEPWRSARENVVVNVFPTMNPDGLDHVVSWYREHVGTSYEASGLLELYQYYAGHDNNRDWFMLTQAETEIATEQLYTVWWPQVYWDVHQQGSSRERIFVPPFRDPLNPNLDPGIIAGIDALGSRALLDLTRWGFRGVSTGVSYDMWWNGGNRNVPVRHNIIGLLTEAASVRIATPIFLPHSELSGPRGVGDYAPSNRFPDPWPGGWWRLRDIIEYELAVGRSLLGSLSREPQTWLRNALEASERTIARGRAEGPRGWLIPSDNRDPAAVRRLVDVLFQSGIEVHLSGGALVADGRTWPAGSIVLRRDQPYGSHLKDMFEVQRYPEGDSPYDVAGWTLPPLLGVRRVELMEEIDAPLTLAAGVDEAVAAFGGAPVPAGTLSASNSDDWTRLIEALGRGEAHTWIGAGERAGLFVPGTEAGADDEQPTTLSSMPRIGLYAPWSGNMDEGWMRWVLDNWRVPYVRVRNEMLRAGELGEFLDVLVIPSISAGQLERGRSPGSVPAEYTRGLAPEGSVAVEEFVRRGGRLVTVGSSSAWAIDLLRLPLVDVTRGEQGGDFSCPGSVLRAVPEAASATAGLSESLAVFFSRSAAWREMEEKEAKEAGLEPVGEDSGLTTLLRYAPSHVLLSGYIKSPEVVENRAAWIEARHGAGTVHLFGFRPQYRGWSQAAFHLLFRALLLE